ncbi:hypothetical protein BB561_005844 [Smittium simulii]|uniref:Uncharacterized protein n=1 Tax=Smittium simulii TaxID=133385 RepID=A0A2T9Y7Y9_9FUNG|nr:hypothetical protein BB561_005844 [Smittium simulii]
MHEFIDYLNTRDASFSDKQKEKSSLINPDNLNDSIDSLPGSYQKQIFSQKKNLCIQNNSVVYQKWHKSNDILYFKNSISLMLSEDDLNCISSNFNSEGSIVDYFLHFSFEISGYNIYASNKIPQIPKVFEIETPIDFSKDFCSTYKNNVFLSSINELNAPESTLVNKQSKLTASTAIRSQITDNDLNSKYSTSLAKRNTATSDYLLINSREISTYHQINPYASFYSNRSDKSAAFTLFFDVGADSEILSSCEISHPRETLLELDYSSDEIGQKNISFEKTSAFKNTIEPSYDDGSILKYPKKTLLPSSLKNNLNSIFTKNEQKKENTDFINKTQGDHSELYINNSCRINQKSKVLKHSGNAGENFLGLKNGKMIDILESEEKKKQTFAGKSNYKEIQNVDIKNNSFENTKAAYNEDEEIFVVFPSKPLTQHKTFIVNNVQPTTENSLPLESKKSLKAKSSRAKIKKMISKNDIMKKLSQKFNLMPSLKTEPMPNTNFIPQVEKNNENNLELDFSLGLHLNYSSSFRDSVFKCLKKYE